MNVRSRKPDYAYQKLFRSHLTIFRGKYLTYLPVKFLDVYSVPSLSGLLSVRKGGEVRRKDFLLSNIQK